MRRLAAVVVLAVTIAGAADAYGRRPQSQLGLLPKSELSVVTAGGTHRFKVWIAADDPSRARGLSFVRKMPGDHGMLFVFGRPRYASFWMKDTWLPLDLVFIGPGGHVVNVVRDAVPMSLAPIESLAPVTAVLEVNAGTAARIGLTAGDRVLHATLNEP